MAREKFRVVANDAHFNGEICRLTHSADSADQLRELIEVNAPNLTIVRIDPLSSALFMELREAREKVRILPDAGDLLRLEEKLSGLRAAEREVLKQAGAPAELIEDFDIESRRQIRGCERERERGFARREKIQERIGSCCALAELLGVEAQESLIMNLRRFDKSQSFAIDGLDSCPFSFTFGWGKDFKLNGGLIFHFSSRTWSMHT
jgi:hypothetical protein